MGDDTRLHLGDEVDRELISSAQNIIHSDQLYTRIISLYQNPQTLEKPDALLIIELIDDAIKEYGNTNQEKKVELRSIKKEIEQILPPTTLDEFKKRSEGQLLNRFYPRKPRFQKIVLISIAIISVTITLIFGTRELIKNLSGEKPTKTATTDNNFPGKLYSNRQIEDAIDRIVKVSGLRRDFKIEQSNVIELAEAFTSDEGYFNQVVIYNLEDLKKLNDDTGTNWAALSILAHEIKHILQGDIWIANKKAVQSELVKSELVKSELIEMELEADEFSGYILGRMGASLEDAQASTKKLISDDLPKLNLTAPDKKDRLLAIETGWIKATASK